MKSFNKKLCLYAGRINPDGVAYPVAMGKNKRIAAVQLKWLKSVGCKEFEEFQEKMQLLKKLEEEQQLFAEYLSAYFFL